MNATARPFTPILGWVTDQKATGAIRTLMPLAEMLGIRADAYSASKVVLSMDWAPGLCTANGLLHGGAIMALADSAGGACAMLNLPDGASGTATIESKTNFLGAVRGGAVSAAARVLHRGATTIVVETEVRDDRGKLVAKVTQTQIVLRAAKS
jgi:1,4-dihydroxy-2-naphthoyl-CoA hydrolase